MSPAQPMRLEVAAAAPSDAEGLVDQLSRTGLTSEVQTADVLGRTVQNVIARVPGSQSAIRNRQSAIGSIRPRLPGAP